MTRVGKQLKQNVYTQFLISHVPVNKCVFLVDFFYRKIFEPKQYSVKWVQICVMHTSLKKTNKHGISGEWHLRSIYYRNRRNPNQYLGGFVPSY